MGYRRSPDGSNLETRDPLMITNYESVRDLQMIGGAKTL
ncbi:MAG: hypothetical protein DF168_00012 [Candidatus Moanabacter tarae]|uniref:Uncharacterized protein n=1 Tax=Candidatus Moanibacter tarae TaxID=2200854 RepID=A0A2Z4AJZ6_9BACT|nr:MAG: hypothetical protein DF168_00012 [Candidatus Moanabacter tarae]